MKTAATDAAKTAVTPRRGWAWAVSTLLGVGHLRPGPGTWGSAVTVLLWFVAARAMPTSWRAPVAIIWVVLITAIGIPAATREARRSQAKDPSHVVVDEMAGQLVTLIAAPLQWKTLLLGFILFRCFDIVKPPPVRQLERLREGVGIVMDDIGAGLYALVALQLLLHLFSGAFR